jgi:hypothetical protein
MIEQLDKQIADLESRLADLRRQKLTALQAQVAELQASITGAPAAARAGLPKASGLAAAARVKAPRTGPKKRGRRPGKRIPDEVLLEQIRVIVTDAGADGISAREVAARTDIFYPKVIKLMKPVFKARGKGKWTRYSLK